MKQTTLVLFMVCLAIISGCAGYSGVIKTGEDTYKVYCRSASGFVSIKASKNAALAEASDYCAMQGKKLKILSIKSSKPPYILGNFPRTTVQFMCLDENDPRIEDGDKKTSMQSSNDLETKIKNLNKLLSDGLITESDFEEQKAKLLNDYTSK